MKFTVHWPVNDGRYGYPNIVAELNWSDVDCKSYRQAMQEHAKQKGVPKILSISETVGGKGKISGQSYRDFYVSYIAKNAPIEKELYVSGEVVAKTVRVFRS